MNGQLAPGDGVRDRIDQERHVVIDDGDAHAPPAGLAARGFNRQSDFAALPLGADRSKEFSGFLLGRGRQANGFAGERILGKRLTNGLKRGASQAHNGGHEIDWLRGRCDARGL